MDPFTETSYLQTTIIPKPCDISPHGIGIQCPTPLKKPFVKLPWKEPFQEPPTEKLPSPRHYPFQEPPRRFPGFEPYSHWF